MVWYKMEKEIIDDPHFRWIVIYKITNVINGKNYIGQAVSHILNHGRYRPYGAEGRFKCHLSEAFSTKTNQCYYLNNAIRKYGKEMFKLETICECPYNERDIMEKNYIEKYNSIFPNGYNLKNGGYSFEHTEESKRRVSKGIENYFKDIKLARFNHIISSDIENDIENHIKPLKRNNIQYGWYVYIKRTKADFGGQHIPLDISKQNAINFIKKLQLNLATHLDAGTS